MVFFVNVAADLYGRKENLRFDFAIRPTMSELINTCESQFDVTSRTYRPAGYPDIPFRIQTFQVYDDILMRWVDLYSTEQLVDGCQVYAFQPESVWNPDYQGTIPTAVGTYSWVGSPRRYYSLPSELGVSGAFADKLRVVFAELDSGNKGYILYSDLRSAFLRYGLEFTYATVGELFNRADTNRDGSISYEEWVRFGMDFPSIVDALFYRQRDLWPAAGSPSRSRSLYTTRTTTLADDILSARRAREIELDRMYRNAEYQARLDDARRDLELARIRSDIARDRYLYNPASPRRYFYYL